MWKMHLVLANRSLYFEWHVYHVFFFFHMQTVNLTLIFWELVTLWYIQSYLN